jgi:hypothetical protein
MWNGVHSIRAAAFSDGHALCATLPFVPDIRLMPTMPAADG